MKSSFTVLLLLVVFAASVLSQATDVPVEEPKALPVLEKESEETDDGIPADFKSDNCSLFPDGNYAKCCVAHDRDYYKGGTCKERSESDKRLYRCVRDTKGWQNKIIAPIMWVGVRIGGVSFLPTPFRWGFGKKKKKAKRKFQKKNVVVVSEPPDSEEPLKEPAQSTEPTGQEIDVKAPPEKKNVGSFPDLKKLEEISEDNLKNNNE